MKKIVYNRYLIGLAILLAGVFLGWLLKPSNEGLENDKEHPHDTISENQTWTCSMHPQIRQPEPGKCPICGMDLIPVSNSGNRETNPRIFEMTPEAVAIANIRTTEVTQVMPEKTLALSGKIAVNEQNIETITAKFPGRLEKLYVNFTGQQITPGQRLATIYSPELISAQRELLEARKSKDIYPELYQAARDKLKNWRITEGQIEKIETTGDVLTEFAVITSSNGVVTERYVAVGDYVSTGTPLFKIADLSKVWVLLDVYESDLAFINTGATIQFTVPALPGKNFTAKVDFIDPVINPETRVARVRAAVNNQSGLLKPEMFVNATLRSTLDISDHTLAVPQTALLWSGKRSVVYVSVPDREVPSFEMREVVLGPELGEMYAVESGLNAGEQVVVNGAFTVDAAAQLNGNYSMMNTTGMTQNVSLHRHGDDQPAGTHADHKRLLILNEDTKNSLKNVLDPYIALKDGLVASDHPKAVAAAKELEKQITTVSIGGANEETQKLWSQYADPLQKTSSTIAQSTDIEEARRHFISLNETMVKLFRQVSGFDENIYVQHCPMANQNEGADWLSLEQEIRNPYYGDAMLTCGEVTATIK